MERKFKKKTKIHEITNKEARNLTSSRWHNSKGDRTNKVTNVVIKETNTKLEEPIKTVQNVNDKFTQERESMKRCQKETLET